MAYQDDSIRDFLGILASGAPSPGGGTASALAGALAASLSAMVGALTADKAGYEDVSEDMRAMRKRAEALQAELLCDMRRDSDAFEAYMRARAMKRDTKEEKAARREMTQIALKEAARAPLQTAEHACAVFPLTRLAIEKGNRNAASDAVSSALLARCAARGALYNVKINLGGIRDEEFAANLSARAAQLEAYAASEEAAIIDASGL